MDLRQLREQALELLTVATAGTVGRGESDPVYQAVVERRDTGKAYSSCGDLAHWLLYRLGVRSAFVNRAEHRGWAMGKNVSRLAWTSPAARPAVSGEQYHAGDILIVWSNPSATDSHVIVVREHTGAALITAEYGQPGGKQCARLISGGRIGNRRIERVLLLERVLLNAHAAGELVAAQSATDWLQHTGLEQPRTALKKGAHGPEVAKAQRALGIDDDGIFGPITEANVKLYQLNHGLTPTGVIDAKLAAILVGA